MFLRWLGCHFYCFIIFIIFTLNSNFSYGFAQKLAQEQLEEMLLDFAFTNPWDKEPDEKKPVLVEIYNVKSKFNSNFLLFMTDKNKNSSVTLLFSDEDVDDKVLSLIPLLDKKLIKKKLSEKLRGKELDEELSKPISFCYLTFNRKFGTSNCTIDTVEQLRNFDTGLSEENDMFYVYDLYFRDCVYSRIECFSNTQYFTVKDLNETLAGFLRFQVPAKK